MTCDERLEALLNRAGQTISDLPKGYLLNAGEGKAIQGVACRWFIDEDAPEGVAFRNLVSIPLYQYILHLTDIIDRMETALENVCGERDWLKEMARFDECPTCSKHIKGDVMVCGIEGDWLENEFGECSRYEYSGVPEDWSVDDDETDKN